MISKLFYKGKPMSSDEAHELSAEEKAWLTARKPSLEEEENKEEKKEKKKEVKK